MRLDCQEPKRFESLAQAVPVPQRVGSRAANVSLTRRVIARRRFSRVMWVRRTRRSALSVSSCSPVATIHGERLAVLHTGRRREIGLRQEGVDRRRQVDAGCDSDAERGPAAGGGHDRCSTARSPRRPGPAPGDFAGNGSSSRTSNVARSRYPATRRVGSRLVRAVGLAGKGPFPAGSGNGRGCPNEQLLRSRGCHAGRAVRR